jgi:hypothetical protein
MTRTTVIMVALGLASVVGAVQMQPQPPATVTYEDTGEVLFDAFKDPSLATDLQVVAWDDETAQAVEFSVMQKDGGWVIPSHNDYPADGTERMAKAAASFVGVKKDLYYGDKVEIHAQFGVLDPTGADGDGDGKGQRITIKDASSSVLVDVIVGKPIPDKQGWYYVRKPEEKRVYGSRLELDISTNFADWIEKDLLHVDRDEFVELIYSPYSVDEATGTVEGADQVIHAVVLNPNDNNSRDWKLADDTLPPDGQDLDSNKIRGMLTSIASMKIVGVRPRPPARSMVEAKIQLQQKGFFVSTDPQNPQLFGNEGQVTAITRDGLVYTLFFGEVTYETGIALSAGKAGAEAEGEDPEATPEPELGAEGEGDTNRSASRYIFVNVQYDPSMDRTLGGDPMSAEPPPPADEDELKGPQRAEQLMGRFNSWFYVISDTSFKGIRKDPPELFKVAAAPAE